MKLYKLNHNGYSIMQASINSDVDEVWGVIKNWMKNKNPRNFYPYLKSPANLIDFILSDYFNYSLKRVKFKSHPVIHVDSSDFNEFLHIETFVLTWLHQFHLTDENISTWFKQWLNQQNYDELKHLIYNKDQIIATFLDSNLWESTYGDFSRDYTFSNDTDEQEEGYYSELENIFWSHCKTALFFVELKSEFSIISKSLSQQKYQIPSIVRALTGKNPGFGGTEIDETVIVKTKKYLRSLKIGSHLPWGQIQADASFVEFVKDGQYIQTSWLQADFDLEIFSDNLESYLNAETEE